MVGGEDCQAVTRGDLQVHLTDGIISVGIQRRPHHILHITPLKIYMKKKHKELIWK